MELKPEEIQRVDVDREAIRVFLKALEIAGGPRELVRRRHLTWVPSLLEASYAVVLREQGKPEEEIAATLGLTRPTVKLILRADPGLVKRRLEESLGGEEARAHVAGGLAQLAFSALKKGEKIELLESLSEG
jgi:probable regulatory domain-containing protein